MKKTLLIVTVLTLFCSSMQAAEPDTLYFTQGKMKSPFVALSLSAIAPGGGQLYNGKLLKSGVFIAAEGVLGGLAYYHYRNYAEGINSTLFNGNDPLQTAKEFTWFFAAVYAYSLMDAYVDAHLSNFPDDRLILEPDPDINGVQLSVPTTTLFGDEKWKHLSSSYLLTLQSAYTLNKLLSVEASNSRYFSIGIGLSVSLGNGIFDACNKKGKFNFENLMYDAIGIGLGYLTAAAIQE